MELQEMGGSMRTGAEIISDNMQDRIRPESPRTQVRHSIHSISCRWPFIMLMFGCLSYYLVYLIDMQLPAVVSEADSNDNIRLFSGERSRNTLRNLTNLGPRVVGTLQNRVQAPAILMDELETARLNAHSSQSLLYEIQNGNGAYILNFKLRFTNVYDGIQNVIAILEGSDKEHGILLNCHYDTVPASDGASDDAISCAVMMELVRVLSMADVRLKHNIIFLFNGAEETPLQASHLFLKHRWAQSARLVLNLEAAGLGGRAILFQSGPGNAWLLNYYARSVPHPYGNVLGEELLRGIRATPPDTDFKIFREFGNMPGLDFAFCHNGYVHHTVYDKEAYISTGSLQHLGDNLLALLRVLGNATEMEDMKANSAGQMVYFDFLGWFMVSYSFEVGIAVNIVVFIISAISVVVFMALLAQWYAWIELAYALAARLGGIYAGLQFNIILGAFIDGMAPLAMPWFSNVWLIFPLFWCPSLVGFELIPIMTDWWRKKKHGLSLSMTAQLNLVAAQIPLAFILFVMTCTSSRSAYVVMIPVLSSALANLLIHLTPLYRTVHKWVWVYLIVHIPSLLFTMYVCLLGYTLFLPTMGRSGRINGDLNVAVMSSVFSLLLLNFAIPLLTLVRKPSIVLGLLGAFSLIMIPVSLLTSIGHPYRAGPTAPAPQRYWIMHSDRQFYNESNMLRRHETGYFILNLDQNSPKTVPMPASSVCSTKKDCNEELYCGFPLYLTKMVPLSQAGSWIPAQAPLIPSPTSLNVKYRLCTASPPKCILHLVLRGPDRLTVTFAPRKGVTLTGWNLNVKPKASGEWKGRRSYFINIVRENSSIDYHLIMKFNVSSRHITTAPMLDVALAGNHVHHENQRTLEFTNFIKKFPDWVQMTGWISAYIAYVV